MIIAKIEIDRVKVYVGGIVGIENEYENFISDCYNTGNISGEQRIGGITGSNQGVLSNSFNLGEISGTGNRVGGIAAWNSYGTINACYNAGLVNGTNYVGGISGFNRSAITNSYNLGAITGSDYLGGIAGYGFSYSINGEIVCVIISSCFNVESITLTVGSTSLYVGGVVGYLNTSDAHSSVIWSYYNTDTSGEVFAIGYGSGYQVYGLTTAQMQEAQNENWMYLSSVFWNFAEGEYPTLKYVAHA